MLRLANESANTLTNWERARVLEWSVLDARGISLSQKQIKILQKMLSDIDDGRKVVDQELLSKAKLANDNQWELYPNEKDFVHKMQNLRLGVDKTTKAERSWLRKIEGRIHKKL